MSLQDNQNPLTQLNDILAPSLPSFWPLAPLYWFLLGGGIIALLGALSLLKKYKKHKLKQKKALQQLQHLKQSKANFVLLNQLLKGVALLYFPRQQVASLHGQQWFDFLQCYAQAPLFENKQHFIKRLYQQDPEACCASDFAQAKNWITALPKQIKKHRNDTKEKHSHV